MSFTVIINNAFILDRITHPDGENFFDGFSILIYSCLSFESSFVLEGSILQYAYVVVVVNMEIRIPRFGIYNCFLIIYLFRYSIDLFFPDLLPFLTSGGILVTCLTNLFIFSNL